MTVKQLLIGLVGTCMGAAALAVPAAYAQESALPEAGPSYSSPNEFYLFDSKDRNALHYTEPRNLRICATAGEAELGLNVAYDGEMITIPSGTCQALTASEVEISPAGPIPRGNRLVGTVETQLP